jgi:hypothetical protein
MGSPTKTKESLYISCLKQEVYLPSTVHKLALELTRSPPMGAGGYFSILYGCQAVKLTTHFYLAQWLTMNRATIPVHPSS